MCFFIMLLYNNLRLLDKIFFFFSYFPGEFSAFIVILFSTSFPDPRLLKFVRGRSTNLALSTRGIEALKAVGVLDYVSTYICVCISP